MLRWIESTDKIVAFGAIKHKVWRAYAYPGFYAKSGLDVHGPYKSAQDARRACEEIESKEGK